ncbi:cysteine-rich and transmembrane domain-containing protein WIH2-like [Durio zibethinus]|uniref:Cysteine-rich and transmembrane domain-containing protein WIH2-like n=1 Tax=Durio zibethinus TaxID=66656 RepID=A0A6P6A517_DURZI|nr:cysteine-rich and transmembrane domain-containing protein WIH2-like [Durio zibethinus]
MSQNLQQINQPSDAYPPPSTAPGSYLTPPPAGYPMTKDGQQYPQNPVAIETKSRGDGFWKGCCAALCCCCALDICL